MSKRFFAGAAAALILSASGTAFAAATPFVGEAKLAKAVAAPSETVIDGVTWSCEGDTCTGRADRRTSLDSHVKECRKVAEALGELTAYKSRGRTVSKSTLRTCNRLAAKS